mgnify:FL=1
MKQQLKALALMAIVAVFTLSTGAQPKYYKPHSVKWMNGTHSLIKEEGLKNLAAEGEDISPFMPDTTTFWTGDAATVDGKECVEVWKEHKGETSFHGYIYEDEKGYVYSGIKDAKDGSVLWYFVNDFSKSDWEVGDSIVVPDCYGGQVRTIVDKVEPYSLCNGETASLVYATNSRIIVGIGNVRYNMLSPLLDIYSYSVFIPIVPYTIAFWRDGVQLFYYEFPPEDEWDVPVGPSGIQTKEVKADCTTYDLQGRPVAESLHGIYIQNGKKVLKR